MCRAQGATQHDASHCAESLGACASRKAMPGSLGRSRAGLGRSAGGESTSSSGGAIEALPTRRHSAAKYTSSVDLMEPPAHAHLCHRRLGCQSPPRPRKRHDPAARGAPPPYNRAARRRPGTGRGHSALALAPLTTQSPYIEITFENVCLSRRRLAPRSACSSNGATLSPRLF